MKMFIPDKTLVIRMSSIGDIVLTTPLIRTFKSRFPESTLDFLVKKEFADLLRYNPYIDTLYEFDSRGGVAGLRRLTERLRQTKYDLVIDAHNSLRSRYIRRKLKPRKKVKIHKRIVPRFFLINFKLNLYRDDIHIVDRYIEPVNRFGVQNDDLGPELFVPETILDHVSEQFKELKTGRKSIIAICPAAKHYTKRWLKEYYVELASMLVSEYNSYIVILGGPEDYAYCEDIKRLIGNDSTLNLAGTVSLLQSAAVFDHCDAVVTNDTGLMHIATARKRNVVAVFGPTVRELGFFPFGRNSTVIEHPHMPCRPCSHIGSRQCPKKHFRCMKEIPPVQVLEAISNYLEDRN
jgi:lipopolysaccharide heptosyltransferase II